MVHTAQVVSLRDARGRRSAEALAELLREADRNLSARLRAEGARFGDPHARFTGASAEAYRAQIRVSLEHVQNRLGGMTEAQSRAAIQESVDQTTTLLGTLEERFTGITRSLRVRQAAVMDRIVRETGASLLAQHATSVDRYGEAMVQRYERTIRAGLLSGASQDEMVAALTGHGGPTGMVSMSARVGADGNVIRLREEEIPEGLFVRHRYWAERIVRTETAHAYQEARIQSLAESKALDMPDLQKKIMAVFDNRTAPDSMAVHGQVRELDAYFQDGAGRQYLRPPGRPNDRETVVPWRPHWDETPTTRPLTPGQVAEAIQEGQPGVDFRRQRLAGVVAASRRERAATTSLDRLEEAARQAQARRAEAQDRAVPPAQPPPEPQPEPEPVDPMVQRRDERRASLAAAGHSAEAIDRDLAEIGTELTPEGIQSQARVMAEASRRMQRMPTTESGVRRQITPEMGETLRGGFRRMIRTVDPGFVSRDVVPGPWETVDRGVVDEGRPQRNRLAMLRIVDEDTRLASHNRFNGGIRINRRTSQGVSRAMRRLGQGRDPGEEGWDHIGAVLHEEHHGGSRIAEHYRGFATVLEESAVESRTRHVVDRLARTVGSAHRAHRLPEIAIRAGRHEVISQATERETDRYQDWVEGLHVAVGRARGLAGAELNGYVQNRLGNWFGMAEPGTVYRTEAEYVAAFARTMDPDNPEQMERLLREHMEEW